MAARQGAMEAKKQQKSEVRNSISADDILGLGVALLGYLGTARPLPTMPTSVNANQART